MHLFLPHFLFTNPSISKSIMDFSKVSILFLTIVLYMLHSANDARVLDERVPLLSFMSGVTSDPGHALANWNASDLSPCEWSGVGCDMAKNRVVELNLSHKSLRGTISPALFALSQLEILDLSGNFLHGHIPPEIASLGRLKELSLSSNSLQGNIPYQVGSLNQLVYLNLGSNKLDGEIPASLFCNASSSLQYLDLSNNSLNGELPQCALSELKYLLLWSNGLAGEIPPALSNSTKLEWLDLESNQFEGELPTTILTRMTHLKFLYLSYNHFSSHNKNTNLAPFFASLHNSCPNLQELDLAGNHLGGALPPIIGNLSALVQINLDTNLIHGEIPPQISNLVNLTLLNLSSNLMNGTIPAELSQMTKLERLYLSNNSLSGPIPASLGNMPHLGLLDLSKNKLQATIPGSFANLIQLRRLLLYENELTGHIPSSLGKCINLEILDLSRNKISGTIPAEVAGLSSLKLYLNLSSNMLTGHIPLELSKMDMVLAIDLSSNNLSGALPSQLGSCIALETLNASHNALEGNFPGAIGSLPYLREIDVSFNRLTGEIPESLQDSASLKVLNFSYNGFRGNVTSKGSFASLTVESFLGNQKLCGSIQGMRSCRRKRARHFLMAILLSLLITPIFCVVGFPLLMRRKMQLPVISAKAAAAVMDEEEGREEIKYPRISRRKLGEATGGFSSSSLIGSGRFGQVYKGILEDNTRIAVKVLNPKTAGEMRGSFKRECQVLKRTRHRNLIRIITACSRPDFKALVLPLMPNGSLEDHLYPPADGMKKGMELDLPMLVGICCDVAQGMAYLHHYAPVKVVHCDLKPSNILLDHDMTALVADFGIARLVKGVDETAANCVDESASYDSTHGLLCGSVGYIAPEYGMGRHASPQGDVYSYGVLVLEIVMGKRPTEVLFHEGSSMHEWVKSHYPNKLGPMVDEAVARMARRALTSHEKKVWSDVVLELVELGLICTQYSPSARPSMLDVAHEITLLKHYVTSSPSTLLIEHTD